MLVLLMVLFLITEWLVWGDGETEFRLCDDVLALDMAERGLAEISNVDAVCLTGVLTSSGGWTAGALPGSLSLYKEIFN